MQHITYEKELEIKTAIVKNAMAKIENLDLENLLQPILGDLKPEKYRNKGTFHVDRSNFEISGKLSLGFVSENSNDIASHNCPFLFSDQIFQLVELVSQQELPAELTEVMVRESHANGDLMLMMIGDMTDLSLCGKCFKVVAEKFPKLKVWGVKSSRGEQYFSNEQQILDEIGNTKYLISPASFFQVNNRQTKVLLDEVLKFLDENDKRIIDAYCGIGTIGLYLANNSDKIQNLMGIEIVASAVDDANKNKVLNNTIKAEFYLGKSEEQFKKLPKQIKPDVVIVDPPRKGCHKQLLDGILDLAPNKVIYVSCNPQTLARDLQLLTKKYKIQTIQPIDLFPRTKHVEAITLMTLA